jgi:hypothetical protein
MTRFSLASVILVVSVAVAGTLHADEQVEARVALDRAIKASGGEAVLSPFKAIRCKAEGTGYEGDKKVPMKYEWTSQGMDRLRTVVFDADGKKPTSIEVVNGKKGWVKDAGQDTEDLSKDQVESRLEGIYTSWASMLVPLKEEGFRLSPLKEVDVQGRKAVGILVNHTKYRSIKLYFDKQSSLQVKYERPFKNVEVGKEMVEEMVCSDFRTVQGTKQAFKFTIFWDGVKVADMRVTEFQLYEKRLDETVFSRP